MSRYETIFLLSLMAAVWALMPIAQLWDIDEPLYVRTGIEMFAKNNLLLPRFNGEVFADKPPLGYWLMGFSSLIFGHTEFAARFFSAPLMALGAFLVGRTARLLYSAQVGEIAMTIVATAFMSVYLGAAAMMDATLFAGYSLCVWVVVKIVIDKAMPLHLLALFSFGLLITLLVKGPVGPALIGGMILIMFAFLPKQDRPNISVFLALFGAGCLSLIGFLAWFLPANIASDGALLRSGIGVHVIGRALSPMEGHGGTGLAGFLLFLPIYIPIIFLGMLPWAVGLPQAIKHALTKSSARNRIILLAWFLPTFLAFTIVATKLPHYIFPALAPLSVAIAAWVVQSNGTASIANRAIAALAYVGYAIGLAYVAVIFGDILTEWKLFLAALVFLSLAIFVVRGSLSPASVPVWAVVSLIAMQGFYWAGLTEIDRLTKVSKTIGLQIKANAPDEAFVLNGIYNEPSLVFYADRPVDNPIFRALDQQIAEAILEKKHGFAVLTDVELAQVQRVLPAVNLTELAQATAYNVNRNSLLQTVILVEWQHSAK